VRGPTAPPSEFADDKPPARLKYTGHFGNRSFDIANEAKHSHRNDTVKSRVMERQSFCLPLNEPYLSALDFGALSRGGDHHRVCIKPRYNCSTPSKFRCKRAVAATDIQQCLVGN
jgi:hypothetical protein